MAKKIIRLTESQLTNLVKKVIKEQAEMEDEENDFERKDFAIMIKNKSANKVRRALENLPQGIMFLAILDCGGADFSGIDLCSFPELKMVNLKDTPSNIDEQGFDCLESQAENGFPNFYHVK